IKNKIIESAHDVSEGGLFVTLLESAFVNDFGFDVYGPAKGLRKDAYWFGESQSRVVVSVKAGRLNEFKKILANHAHEELGIVTDGVVKIDGMNWGNIVGWKEKYNTAIEQLLAGSETESALSAL
ncbi:MAG TPA: AIR synthase-related protein, partial [Puia sp.]|nr:AIR synthase-related protein [Puia sp.]